MSAERHDSTQIAAVWGLMVCSTALACESGQETSGPGCRDQPTSIATLDEATPAGVTGRELLARALGEHPMTVAAPEEVAHQVEVTPQSVGATGAIDIRHAGGELRHVKSEEVPCTARECPSIAVYCIDRLELDVSVALSTSDGAFSDNFQGTLVIDDPNDPDSGWDEDPGSNQLTMGLARIELDIDPQLLMGSFRVTSLNVPDDVEDVQQRFWLELEFADGALKRGDLRGMVSWIDGDAAAASLANVYTFVVDASEG